jgi:hypothetical protein
MYNADEDGDTRVVALCDEIERLRAENANADARAFAKLKSIVDTTRPLEDRIVEAARAWNNPDAFPEYVRNARLRKALAAYEERAK